MYNYIKKALSKEMKYEQLMFNEEKIRERDEKIAFEKKMEELKEKEDCMKRDVKKNELKAERKGQKKEAGINIAELETTIKNIVLKKRQDAAKKLEIMRKMSEIRRKKDQSQMQEFRVKMASEVLNSDKKGNVSTCRPNATKDEIKNYCNVQFSDDIAINLDCRNPDNFCFICCEYELGAKNFEAREDCFDGCGEKSGGHEGGWVFLPPTTKVVKSS